MNYIESKIECVERDTSNGKEITLKNKSDIEVIDYIITTKCPLPKNVIPILEKSRKKDLDGYIDVFLGEKEKIKFNFGNIYMSGKDINLFSDVYWYLNLNPNETKVFNVIYKKK